MYLRIVAAVAASALLSSPASGFDAGGFAMQQHQHQLMRQQSTPNNSKEQPRARRYSSQEKSLRGRLLQRKQRLRIEYEQRVRRDGRPSADRWLKKEATRLGREAGRAVRDLR
ncbi:hypothetical protein M0654_08455 [Rhizobium sp. NTR19]|uniref:Uncharacterized protein n=1 Tax=Neorhizobium turbinariae TaxID=2937795 RepID=A0ABT0IQ57_9HYPH|nr:hypothetical protein [Neorhizobium turbinariae]MCK8780014.1 hypothetical protein [Neorhizobium turbinariae]